MKKKRTHYWLAVDRLEPVMDEQDVKTCPQCGTPKSVSEYCKCGPARNGWAGWCRACSNAASRAYRATAKGKAAYSEYEQSTERKAAHRDRMREGRKNDPARRLQHNVSSAVLKAIRATGRSKAGRKAFAHLPYTPQKLKAHLEALWEPWMNWSNYGCGPGKWNIDHIIPQSAFHFTSMSDPAFRACWALGNLRPLEFTANVRKGHRLELVGVR